MGLKVSEKKIFLNFSHYKSMGAMFDPRGLANLDPRGLCRGPLDIATDVCIMVLEDFLYSSHYKAMGAIGPWGVASLDPGGFIGRIYVGDH